MCKIERLIRIMRLVHEIEEYLNIIEALLETLPAEKEKQRKRYTI